MSLWHEDSWSCLGRWAAGGWSDRSASVSSSGWNVCSGWNDWSDPSAWRSHVVAGPVPQEDGSISEAWAMYDKSKVAEVNLPATEVMPSKRATNLAKAFQNYRRTIGCKLEQARLKSSYFKRWHCVAVPVAPSLHDLVWTEEEMGHFLTTVASFESQVAHRTRVKAQRENRNHPDHGKRMPRLIPPSYVKLWQVCLSQSHSELYWTHFGNMPPAALLMDPLAVIAERKGGLEYVPCSFQERLFDAAFTKSIDIVSSTFAEGTVLMDKMDKYKGAKLWTYLYAETSAMFRHSHWTRSRFAFEHLAAIAAKRSSADRQEHEQRLASSCGHRTAEQTVQDVRASLPLRTDDGGLDAAIAAIAAEPIAVPDSGPVHGAYAAAERMSEVHFALACAVTRVVAELNSHAAWRFTTVVQPCMEWCFENARALLNGVDVSPFGSCSYSLSLATSDFDVAVVLAPGRSGVEWLDQLRTVARSDCRASRISDHTPPSTQTLQLKFLSVWADIHPVKAARSADYACLSSDLLKLMVEQRARCAAGLHAVLTFKLLCHHLRLCQRHMETRGSQFKAIVLCFFAWAILDAMPARSERVADSATGVYLLTLIGAFLSFDWAANAVMIKADGSTSFVKKSSIKKTDNQDVVVFLEVQNSNCAFNVDMANVEVCRSRLRSVSPGALADLLAEAIASQDIPRRVEKIETCQQKYALANSAVSLPSAGVSADFAVEHVWRSVVASAGPPLATDPLVPWSAVSSGASFAAASPTQPLGGSSGALLGATSAVSLPSATVSGAFGVEHPRRSVAASAAPPMTTDPLVPCSAVSSGASCAVASPTQLVAGDSYFTADGETMRVTITEAEGASLSSPVLCLLPGSGGFYLPAPVGLAPIPCWYVVPHIHGKSRSQSKRSNSAARPLPDVVLALLRQIRQLTLTSRKVILAGFSRGASWIVELAQDHADLFDAGLMLAPYPRTTEAYANTHGARALMQVRVPLLLLHFIDDYFCNAFLYTSWFAEFTAAMAIEPGESYGRRQSSFLSWVLLGDHDKAEKLFASFRFELEPSVDLVVRSFFGTT